MATTAAFQPRPHMAVYYATEAYVLSFTNALARELKGTGLTATALRPGPVATGFQVGGEFDASSHQGHEAPRARLRRGSRPTQLQGGQGRGEPRNPGGIDGEKRRLHSTTLVAQHGRAASAEGRLLTGRVLT